MPISLKAASGGGSTPVGSLTVFPNSMPIDFVQENGDRYLRSGFIETNTANFDNTLFGQSRATFWQPTSVGVAGQPPQTMATNGSGIFVAIHRAGTQAGGFRRSTNNGVTWGSYTIITPTGAGHSLNDIVWASSLSLFVIVGDNGLIFTSPDGLTWTQRTSGTTNALLAIGWNGSVFVAVGANGEIRTSANGTTWTARTSPIPTSQNINCVAFGSGVWFILSGTATGSAATSNDNGATWTTQTVGASVNSSPLNGGLLHDGTRFVLIHSTIGIYTSTNGATWSLVAGSQQLNIGNYIGFANGQYVASGSSSSGAVLVSTDLTNWKVVKVGQGSAAGTVAMIRFVFDRWILACPTPSDFYFGNGYLYAGWPYEMRESNGNDTTSYGIYYVRIS